MFSCPDDVQTTSQAGLNKVVKQVWCVKTCMPFSPPSPVSHIRPTIGEPGHHLQWNQEPERDRTQVRHRQGWIGYWLHFPEVLTTDSEG